MPSEIVEAFEKLRRDHPERKLVYLPARGKAFSAADIWEEAMRIRDAFRTAGAHTGAIVLSGVGNHPAALAVLLACRCESLPLLPVDGGTTIQETAALAAAFGARFAIVPEGHDLPGFVNPITQGGLVIATSELESALAHTSAAVLKLTSGSTGSARAAVAPESALVSDGTTLAAAMDIKPTDVQIAAIPLTHSYALGNLVMPLLLQGTAMVLRDGFVPQRIPDDAVAFHARHLPGVPYMFEHFATHPPTGGWPASLTRLVSAGALLKSETAARFQERFGIKVHSFYGTSETGGIAFDNSNAAVADGTVGFPLPGVTITLRPDAAAEPTAGRVHVKGGSVCAGYAGPDDSQAFRDGGFLTGDIGQMDNAGQLTLVGRVSTFVNVAGRKVQADEVERTLRQFPGLADVRVFGVDDPRRGEQLVACVAFATLSPSVVELRQFCGARLAPHKIPRVFVFVPKIPLTDRGKTDRAHLTRLASAEIARAGML